MKKVFKRFWRWINEMPPKRDEHAIKKRKFLRWLYEDS